MKIRKVKRKKNFRYNVNRKRLRKVQTSTGNIKCREIQKHWEDKRSIRTNLKEMGLALDANEAVGLPNTKQERIKLVKLVRGVSDEDDTKSKALKPKRPPRKEYVARQLDEDAKAPRESQFRLPKGYISELAHFLDKHKFDYHAMVSDPKNYKQWTWRQFRAKIKKFMSIPAQFYEYLKNSNLTKDDVHEWKEYDSD